MKLLFTGSARRLLNKTLVFVFGWLILLPFAAMPQQATYNNSGTITGTPPNVDATNFVNSGTWNIDTTAPYETANTLNYTNTGTMVGSVGWEFDYGPLPAGGRGMSANFFNGNGGMIQAVDGDIVNPENSLTFTMANYLLISATNIVNKGTLSADSSGEMVLTGTNINLSRSGLEIASLKGQGSINSSNTFIPDIAIYDELWLSASNSVLSADGSIWDGTNVSRFNFFGVGEPCVTGTTSTQIGPLTPQVEDSYTNGLNSYMVALTNSDGSPGAMVTLYSNIVRQAVFVAYNTNDPIFATNHFSPALVISNAFETVAVQFNMISTNVVTQAVQTNTFYLVDDLASSTNLALLANTVINPAAACSSPTFRPASVVVSRTDPVLMFASSFPGETTNGPAFASGTNGLGPPANNFFYDMTFSNAAPKGVCDLYSALIDNLSSEVPAGGSITNVAGRINITAGGLDLTKTRMDCEGAEITIVATNLIGSAGADISCQNLSYNLGSTAGFLNVTNLALSSVSGLQGTVSEWSGLWTNYMNVYFPTNYAPDSTGTNFVLAPLTNVVEVDLAITVVDATGLSSSVPVTVQNLTLNSTNMVISDSMTIGQSLLLNGQSLTLQTNLFGLTNWVYTEAPMLRYFTNNGALHILNNANFGDDGPTNYAEFVNNGNIVASTGSQTINSVDYQNTGSQSAAGGFFVTAATGEIENGSITSGQDVDFYANTLKLNNATITAGGTLNFDVTNSFSDAGASSGNVLSCTNGFNLSIPPATGDLLGTTLETIAPAFASVTHTWAGQDFGATTSGFTNTAAIGTLMFVAGGSGSGQEPQFIFNGTGASNGLYVDYLDVSQLTNYTFDSSLVSISPNLTIYFAKASTNPAALTNAFGGRLQWVQGVVIPGQNPTLSGSSYNKSAGTFQFSITNGVPGQTNIIQATTNLVTGPWVAVYTNIGSFTYTNLYGTNYPNLFFRDIVP